MRKILRPRTFLPKIWITLDATVATNGSAMTGKTIIPLPWPKTSVKKATTTSASVSAMVPVSDK